MATRSKRRNDPPKRRITEEALQDGTFAQEPLLFSDPAGPGPLLSYRSRFGVPPLAFQLVGTPDQAESAFVSGSVPILRPDVQRIPYEERTIPDYLREALAGSNDAERQALEELARQSYDRSRVLSEGALLAMSGPALTQLFSGYEVNDPYSALMNEMAMQEFGRASDLRGEAEYLSRLRPAQDRLRLAEMQMTLDEQNRQGRERVEADYLTRRQQADQHLASQLASARGMLDDRFMADLNFGRQLDMDDWGRWMDEQSLGLQQAQLDLQRQRLAADAAERARKAGAAGPTASGMVDHFLQGIADQFEGFDATANIFGLGRDAGLWAQIAGNKEYAQTLQNALQKETLETMAELNQRGIPVDPSYYQRHLQRVSLLNKLAEADPDDKKAIEKITKEIRELYAPPAQEAAAERVQPVTLGRQADLSAQLAERGLTGSTSPRNWTPSDERGPDADGVTAPPSRLTSSTAAQTDPIQQQYDLPNPVSYYKDLSRQMRDKYGPAVSNFRLNDQLGEAVISPVPDGSIGSGYYVVIPIVRNGRQEGRIVETASSEAEARRIAEEVRTDFERFATEIRPYAEAVRKMASDPAYMQRRMDQARSYLPATGYTF